MFTFNTRYFTLAVLIFVFEILIALYVRDAFIRPYVGDALVVILIYSFVKAFVRLPVFNAAMIVLVFSFIVEFLQYLNIVKWLGLQHSKVARIVIGTSFAWEDLIAYTAGIVAILLIETQVFRKAFGDV